MIGGGPRSTRESKRTAGRTTRGYILVVNDLIPIVSLSSQYSQEVFMENYITSQRDHMFRNVEVMIYVFDVESRDLEKDLHYYQSCVGASCCFITSSIKQQNQQQR